MSNYPQGAATDRNAPYNDNRKPSFNKVDVVIGFERTGKTSKLFLDGRDDDEAIVELSIDDSMEEHLAIADEAMSWCKANEVGFIDWWMPTDSDWKNLKYL
jgi:hypothetical protein